jgi:hypothetical protein
MTESFRSLHNDRRRSRVRKLRDKFDGSVRSHTIGLVYNRRAAGSSQLMAMRYGKRRV